MLSPLASFRQVLALVPCLFGGYGYVQAPNIILQLQRCRAGECKQFSLHLKISAKAIHYFSIYIV